DTPYYSGDLEVYGTGVHGKETRFDGTVQLAAGCPLGVQVYQTQEEARVELHVPELSRDQLQQNLPERFSVLLDHVPGLEVLQGEATATWHQPEYKVDIQLAPRLRGIKDTVKVSLAGGGATYTGPLFSGKLDAQTGTASIHAGLVFTSANDFTLDAVLDKVPVREWVRAWTEAPFPETLEAVASGTANVAASAEGYTATVELTALAPAYGEFRLPAESEAKLTGSATLSKDASAARDITMKLAIAESLTIQVSGGTFDLKTLGGAGALTGQADLGYLGAILSQPDLFGSVDISGPATLKGMDSLEIALRLESESLGYRDWATPYRMPLLVEGPVILSPAEQHVTGADIKIQLGETNRVQLGSFSLAGGETLTLEAADVHVESDLSPLAAMEWLSDAQAAHATLDAAKVQWDATGFSGDVNVLVEAARLALPKNVASLEAAYGEGQFTYQSGFTGEGRLEARRILAGGVSAEGINSTVRGEGPDLVLEKIQSALFDGSVAGSVRLGLAREQLAVEVALQLENIDLAAFTAQFKPPGITLTGRSSGTAFVVFGRDGMKDFKADLSAGEGFSLNRDMVERVLLSQYIGEVSGGKKAQKWVEKVIGKAQQRPFDSATLNLGFKDNKIVGVILLKSKDLNYTVDVTADPESLVEALRLRQEERTSTSTVQ
ncbi:MAG: hypothetical protein HYV26_15710, partial [Candidatus Hydrogenedentes bacterium]|nr:hypothetical protein [Candidatus Hydrogenedentota bacterium]